MKKYIKPETLTVNLQHTTPLLVGSPDSFINEYTESPQLSHESFFTDEEIDVEELEGY